MGAKQPQPVDWLLVAAQAAEAYALAGALSARALLSPRILRGELAGMTVALLHCGVGPRRAQNATRAALTRCAPDRVLSVGTCGALVEGLPPGTVVTAACVGAAQIEPLPGLRSVRLETVDRGVFDDARRDTLASAGFEACEMEAAGVARAIPIPSALQVMKVVSDLAGTADRVAGLGHLRVRRETRMLVRDYLGA
jgi:nucleoside phosphorylase